MTFVDWESQQACTPPGAPSSCAYNEAQYAHLNAKFMGEISRQGSDLIEIIEAYNGPNCETLIINGENGFWEEVSIPFTRSTDYQTIYNAVL